MDEARGSGFGATVTLPHLLEHPFGLLPNLIMCVGAGPPRKLKACAALHPRQPGVRPRAGLAPDLVS